jgi:hypothetical protein
MLMTMLIAGEQILSPDSFQFWEIRIMTPMSNGISIDLMHMVHMQLCAAHTLR